MTTGDSLGLLFQILQWSRYLKVSSSVPPSKHSHLFILLMICSRKETMIVHA